MGGMPILSKHEEGATVSPHLSYENRLASNLLSVKINFENNKKMNFFLLADYEKILILRGAIVNMTKYGQYKWCKI